MFTVVVCPRCRRAKGVELRKKTTSCPCGFVIRVSASRLPFETADAREAAKAVGEASARLAGGEDVRPTTARPRKRGGDAFARVVAAASAAGDRQQRVRTAAEELTREFVVFSAEDWARVLGDLGIPKPDAVLKDLVRANVLYEPRPGYYRTV